MTKTLDNGIALKMSSEITAILTLVSGVVVASATYLFTKWKEREAQWRKDKMEVYKEFVRSLGSSFAMKDETYTAITEEFVSACNRLNLVAPQAVIESVMRLLEEHKPRDNFYEIHISNVFYEIRKDLKISPKDCKDTFRVRVWLPPKNE